MGDTQAGAGSGHEGRVTGLWHAGVTVSDMNAALGFYRDALGLEVLSTRELDGAYCAPIIRMDPESVTAVFLGIPNTDSQIELFEYKGLERHSASSRPCDYGAGHFCLLVDDVDAVHRRITDLGFDSRGSVVEIDSGPRKGAKAVYLKDPDGYHVEIYQPPPAG